MTDELPDGWAPASLGDLVEVLDGQRVPVNSDERAKRPGNVPYYGATGQVGWIDDFIFDEPLVLVGEDGAPFLDKSKRIAYLISGKAWVNNHAHVLRAVRVSPPVSSGTTSTGITGTQGPTRWRGGGSPPDPDALRGRRGPRRR